MFLSINLFSRINVLNRFAFYHRLCPGDTLVPCTPGPWPDWIPVAKSRMPPLRIPSPVIVTNPTVLAETLLQGLDSMGSCQALCWVPCYFF